MCGEKSEHMRLVIKTNKTDIKFFSDMSYVGKGFSAGFEAFEHNDCMLTFNSFLLKCHLIIYIGINIWPCSCKNHNGIIMLVFNCCQIVMNNSTVKMMPAFLWSWNVMAMMTVVTWAMRRIVVRSDLSLLHKKKPETISMFIINQFMIGII